jgi:hypothetical protein
MYGCDSGSGSPSNLPPAAATYSLYILVFSISASVCHKMKSYGIFIVGYKSRAIRSRQERGERGHDSLDGPHHVA